MKLGQRMGDFAAVLSHAKQVLVERLVEIA